MSALVDNKKARFNYDIVEEYDAGIELLGFEVKSLKHRQGSLLGAYIIIRGGEAYLVGATIPPYQPANTPVNYDPTRPRRLLLTKGEIGELAGAGRQKRLTIIPLSVYNKRKNIKIKIGLGRGKKKHDKREIIKKRQTEREVRREVKGL